MTASPRLKLLNLLLFQVGWFACVLGAAWGYPWAGVSGVGALLALHLVLAAQPSREALLIFVVGAIGFAWETWQHRYGILAYPTAAVSSSVAPLWMAALWLNFATTLNLSLSWFKSRKRLAAVAASIAAPLAYFGGMNLGAIAMPELELALVSVGLGWAVLFPVCLWLAIRLNGFVHTDPLALEWIEERPRV